MSSISAPQSNMDDLVKRASKFVVLVGDEDGAAPTVDDEDPRWQLLSISLGSGADRIDAFRVRYDLSYRGESGTDQQIRLQDTGTPVKVHRQIEVRRLDEDGEPTILVAWGFLAMDEKQIGSGESLEFDVRADRFLFGDVLESYPVWDPTADLTDPDLPVAKAIDIQRPLVFNPEIDEQIEGNMSDKEQEDAETDEEDEKPRYFLDPESVRTDTSRSLQEQQREEWTIARAVQRLCWTCNPDETHIKNPLLPDIENLFEDFDDDLKNKTVDYGQYLPQCLDQLLKPLGFAWRLRHSLNEDGERESTIECYRRGRGDPVEVLMQRVGERFSFKDTTADTFRSTLDLTALANHVVVRGSFKRIEGTFRLYPSWPAADDVLDSAYLDPGQEGYRLKPDVFRKWVCNEAKDYTDDRDANKKVDFSDLSFSRLLSDLADEDWFQRRRRRLWPCLSQHTDEEGRKESNGYIVEYWDRDHKDGDGEVDAEDPDTINDPGWVHVPEPFSVLEKECGIYFHKVPGRLQALFMERASGTPPDPEDVPKPGLYLRVTASVDADVRLEATHDWDESPQGETIKLYLDLPDKFHWRQVSEESAFFEDPSDEVNDQEKADDYAERIFDIENAALITCAIGLPAVDHVEMEIGKLIEKIGGRDIDLRGNADDAAEPRRLQIVGLNLQLEGTQRTELVMESHKQDRPQVTEVNKFQRRERL